MGHEGDGDTNCCWWTRNDPQKIDKGAGSVGNGRNNRNHPNCSIIEIDQNTQKNPGDLRKLTVTQTRMKNYQLTLG